MALVPITRILLVALELIAFLLTNLNIRFWWKSVEFAVLIWQVTIFPMHILWFSLQEQFLDRVTSAMNYLIFINKFPFNFFGSFFIVSIIVAISTASELFVWGVGVVTRRHKPAFECSNGIHRPGVNH